MVVWFLAIMIIYYAISGIMPSLSDEMFKRLLFFRLVTAFLVICENADVQ